MLAQIRDAFIWTRDMLAFAPPAVDGSLILALAVIAALAVHAVAVWLLHRILGRRPYLRTLLTATKGPTRLALLVFALFIVLPVLPFGAETTAALVKILSLATIVLFGWIAVVAVHTAGDLYLLRYRLDDPDNLLARKHVTQVRILRQVVDIVILTLTVSGALMTFDAVRQYGVSLFASAGVAGIVAGLAARPMLSNLIAGIQIATTQPIRIDDEVVVEGQWGRIQEITSAYVVINLWDLRQLVVPLSYFIEKPFENWTRETNNLLGAVSLYLDYTVPIERVREKALEIVKASPLWDGTVAKLIVNDTKETSLELRVIASARSSSTLGDLRNEIREKLVTFLQQEYPGSLPRVATPVRIVGAADAATPRPAPPSS